MVANSELAIARGDFEEALKILGDVRSESPAYTRVQVPNVFGARHKVESFIGLARFFPLEAIALYSSSHPHSISSTPPRKRASG